MYNICIRKCFIPLCLFLICHIISGQSGEITTLDPTLQNYAPASPEVSSLMKFENIPVSEATGIPSIDVPIYSYSNSRNELSLGISLSYHAGGVKLNEPSSSVGLSWSLVAGGVISRTVRGIYDEKPDVGFLYQDELPNETEGNSPGDISFRPYNDMYANVLDSQSDIFSISCTGLSAKFMLGKNGDILILDQSKVKIEKTLGNVTVDGSSIQLITGFEITNIDGTKYVFSDYEVTTNLGSAISNKYTSSWHLSKIISSVSTKDTISFSYVADDVLNYTTSNYQTSYLRVDGSGNEISSSGSSSQNITAKYLQEIILPDNVVIEFDYDTNGVDNIIGRRLQKINISDGVHTKGYLLEHDYSLNRLTLKHVRPYGGSEANTDAPFSFEYIGSLPDMYTEVPDHWGYYRGNSGGSYIPREIFPNGLGNGIHELPGGSRDTDSIYVRYGSLRKMTYPTGGYAIFDMSANKAVDNWLDKEFQVTVPGDSYRDKSTTEYLSSEDPYPSVVADMLFEGNPNTGTEVELSYITAGLGTCAGNCKIVAEIYSSSNFTIGNLVDVLEVPYSSSGGSATFYLPNLINGNTYKAVLYTNGLYDYSCYVTIDWREQITPEDDQITYTHRQPYIGGLRVDKISDFDGTHSVPVRVRTYKYVDGDGITSSGTLGVHPVYSHATYYANKSNTNGAYVPPINPPENYSPTNDNVIVRSSSPLYDLATYNGSPVLYKRVEIIEDSLGNNNGKEVKYFTNYKDSPILVNSIPFPFVPVEVENWKYGLLKKHLIYNGQNELVKRMDNIYDFSQDTYFQNPIRLENFKSISIAPVYFFTGSYVPNPSETPPTGTPIYFLSQSFYPSSGRSDIERVIDSSFYDTGGFVKETVYNYDQDYFSLKSTEMIDSRGDNFKTEYIYPYDRLGTSDPSGTHQGLLDKNDISAILEQIDSVNDDYLTANKYSYKNWGNGVILPDTIHTSKSNSGYDDRIVFSGYDPYGNPTELKKVGGAAITYLWGYNGQYPVAKIENATYAEVLDTGVDLAVLESTSSSETAKVAELNKIRNHPSMSGAMVTTYTYDPLVGVTSITDPKGQTTSYEYDPFNRLEFIKDDTNDLLEEYQYHYRGE